MGLKNEINELLGFIKFKEPYLQLNSNLFDVYDGELLQYILADLEKEFSQESFQEIKGRVAPINFLQKLVDKLAKIYQEAPARNLVDGSDSQSDLLKWYERNMRVDKNFNQANEFFNISKNSLIQPYAYKGKPAIRVIPNDRFLVYSKDIINPLNPTHVIIIQDIRKKKTGEIVTVYRVTTDDEFVIFDSQGEILLQEMFIAKNPDGINPIGRLPYTYVNRSQTKLIPTHDSDLFKMIKLIPILLSDLNYAVKYQAFSIMYGINVDSKNLKMSPNSFWEFQSDKTLDTKPEVGSIKPQVDIDQVLNLIQAELSMWLQSKNIKPGAIGDVGIQNAASGISKIVDEMDTSEERQKQVTFFKDGEDDFWDLTTNYMHPHWRKTGEIDIKEDFGTNTKVETNFAEQIPLSNRKDTVETQKAEVDAGFTTRKRAIKKLNPKMTEKEVDEMILEIDQERTIEVEEIPDDPIE